MRRYFYFSRDDKQSSRTAAPSPYLQKHMRSRLDGVLLGVFTRCVREWLWTSSTKKKKKKKHGGSKTFDFWGGGWYPWSCRGWRKNCYSEQCANNATMCQNLDRRRLKDQLMDRTKSAIYINPISTPTTLLFSFFKEMWTIKMLHKCICICFELVLRIVLQKWVKTIYMKLYCIKWEKRDDGEKKTYASQTVVPF